MSTLAEVRLWGKTIGAVSLDDNSGLANFQYDPLFAGSAIEVSPIVMPLGKGVYSFPQLAYNSFHGLPGLLADSLPDKFGNALINAWLARQGRTPESFNAVERLCYTGRRGMGALEYFPVLGPDYQESDEIRLDDLVKLASDILTHRDALHSVISDDNKERALKNILRVGTSAGGARAKAVIAWNEQTGEIRSGQLEAGKGFGYWLLKFDGVQGNKDRELDDPQGYGAVEYAYHKMATAAGIQMSECRLMEENGRRHFMTRRFDRSLEGEKIHMQSLGALAHFDFNMAGAYSYEQAFAVIRRLGLSTDSVEELFRRMVFNIMARNQDDHVKNIAFLMDKRGEWRLAPAYDLTYSFNPQGLWTSSYQMSMNGKRAGFTLGDFRECAKIAILVRGRADRIIGEVTQALRQWPKIAQSTGIAEITARLIGDSFRFF